MFEDRYGYEDDEFESDPAPIRRVPVYTVPATNTGQERTLAVVTNPGGAAPRMLDLDTAVRRYGLNTGLGGSSDPSRPTHGRMQ